MSSTWTHLGKRRGRRLCRKATSTPQWNNLLSRLGCDLWHVLHSRLQVQEVLNHFSLVRYIGIGIGLGANVLVRHALQVGVQIVKYLDQNLTLLRSQLKWLHHVWIDRRIKQRGSKNRCLIILSTVRILAFSIQSALTVWWWRMPALAKLAGWSGVTRCWFDLYKNALFIYWSGWI